MSTRLCLWCREVEFRPEDGHAEVGVVGGVGARAVNRLDSQDQLNVDASAAAEKRHTEVNTACVYKKAAKRYNTGKRL